MKGVLPDDEIKRLPTGWALRESCHCGFPGWMPNAICW
jgi:hypothetical protein